MDLWLAPPTPREVKWRREKKDSCSQVDMRMQTTGEVAACQTHDQDGHEIEMYMEQDAELAHELVRAHATGLRSKGGAGAPAEA